MLHPQAWTEQTSRVRGTQEATEAPGGADGVVAAEAEEVAAEVAAEICAPVATAIAATAAATAAAVSAVADTAGGADSGAGADTSDTDSVSLLMPAKC